MSKVFAILSNIFLLATLGSLVKLILEPASTSPLVILFGALTYICVGLFFYTSEVE